MEEKYIIEEATRRSICRHGFNASKVAEELSLPLDYVVRIREKMGKEIAKDPSASLRIANTVSRHIIEGRNERIQIKRDMLALLLDREQMWVCVKCDTEVQEVPDQSWPTYHCPNCDRIVQRKLRDKDEIYRRKQSLLRDLLSEDQNLVDWLVKLKWTGAPEPVPEATKQIINQKVLVLGSDEDKRIISDYSKLPPMEREKLIEKLRREIINIDDEDITEEDNEPK
jgi:hypothetical protein